MTPPYSTTGTSSLPTQPRGRHRPHPVLKYPQKGREPMKILKNYHHDPTLRSSFNALAEETFGLNFENWYRLGYWGDNYTPYSIAIDGKIVANVSLNRTDLVINGERKRVYQLGTVMTAPEYRNRGYIRAIMAEIEKDTADADGIYLFANDSVVDFYPKFGFLPGKEHIFTKNITQTAAPTMTQIPMTAPENRDKLLAAIRSSTFPTACHMVDNEGLIFFYAAQFMQENVYFCQPLQAWAIAELEDGNLTLHNVFTEKDITLDQIIAAFGPEVTTVTLGFTPADCAGYTCREYQEDDCHFFVKGAVFSDFSQKNLRIPTLSHA